MFLIIQNADKSLDCGSKLEHPEEMQADVEKRELHTEGPQPGCQQQETVPWMYGI